MENKNEWFWFKTTKKNNNKNLILNKASPHIINKNKIILFHCNNNKPQISYFNSETTEFENSIVLKKHKQIEKHDFKQEFLHDKTYLVKDNLFILKYTVPNDISPFFMINLKKEMIYPILTISKINSFNYSSCMLKTSIYLFGGFSINGILNNFIFRFDLISLIAIKLEIKGVSPSPRHSSYMKYYKENIFLIGGSNSINSFKYNLNDFWQFKIKTKNWIKIEKIKIIPNIQLITEDDKVIYILNGKEKINNCNMIDCNLNWNINKKVENYLKSDLTNSCIYNPYQEIIWIFGGIYKNKKNKLKIYNKARGLKFTKNIDLIKINNLKRPDIKIIKNRKLSDDDEDEKIKFEEYLKKLKN